MARRPETLTLRITTRKNRASTSYQLVGKAGDEYVRKSFPNLQEAEAEKQRLTAKVLRSQTFYTVSTRLTDEQVLDAEAARAALDRSGLLETSLVSAIEYYTRFHKPVTRMKFVDLIALYGEHRSKHGVRPNTVKVDDYILKSLQRETKAVYLSDLSVEDLKSWVMDKAIAPRTQRDRRDRTFTFFQWAVAHGFADQNLSDLVTRRKVETDEPCILTPEETRELLLVASEDEHSEGRMLPYFALCALSGVRPDEGKRVTDWSSFIFDSSEPHVVVSKRGSKTRRRFVALCPLLVFILKACKAAGMAPGWFSERAFNRIRKDAHVMNLWGNDILRHSYASYHYALHHDVSFLEANMGTSRKMLEEHYLAAVTQTAARSYFDVWPLFPRFADR